jgi:hypothetical protein
LGSCPDIEVNFVCIWKFQEALFAQFVETTTYVEVLTFDTFARECFTNPVPNKSFIVVARLSCGIHATKTRFECLKISELELNTHCGFGYLVYKRRASVFLPCCTIDNSRDLDFWIGLRNEGAHQSRQRISVSSHSPGCRPGLPCCERAAWR